MAGKNKKDLSGDEMVNLEEQMKKLDTGVKRDINILLLGETGVGKSTFINAFCNYLRFPYLQLAMKESLTTLIPARFTITDENYEEQVVQVGADENEFAETGASATQSCRSYVFPIKKGRVRVRLIDTPGVGDTRGIDQDNMNFENILSFIGEFKHLNAICILLKPNSTRLTVMFEFCVKQLLSRLEKSASQNLVFVFTNSRSTFYRPGESLPLLKTLLSKIESVNIPLAKENIFCTDNEAFRFLAAVNNGIKFNKMDVDNFAQSWKKSWHECWRMIWYIGGGASKTPLTPHLVKNTISVNEARRLIVQLSQPLAEIAQLIQDNITILQRHKATLGRSDNTLADLRKKLYIPTISLKVKKMDQPTTVCTSPQCSEVYMVGDRQKWHYHQRCHSPCYLKNVPKEIIGSPELANCAAMNGTTTCKQCKCSYQVHMHIYYETETYEEKLEDQVVKSEIVDKQMALMQAKNVVIKIERRLKEYSDERDMIIKTTAKFACFLQANAIAAYNDAYEAYLRYLIDREESLGPNSDYLIISEFKTMLKRYNEEKNVLNNALARSLSGVSSITADEIIDCVESLYGLKHNGRKIQELFITQKTARKEENQSEVREYVHVTAQQKKKKKPKKNQQVNDTTDSEYATDNGRSNNNRYYNRRFNNQSNFGQNQYHNQKKLNNQQYPNQYQYHQNRQSPDIAINQPRTNPAQFLQIRQGPSGNFDLRFGQTNPDPKSHVPQEAQGFGFYSSMPQLYPGPTNTQYSDQHHGAYPKTYNTEVPPYRNYRGNQRHYGGKPNPRSHSPNPVGSYNYQAQQNHFPEPNQGGRFFSPGPNYGGRPYSSGPQHFNQNQNFHNQNTGYYNHEQKSLNQGPIMPLMSNARPQERFNQGAYGLNQGPKSVNQNWRGNRRNEGQHHKPLNKDQMLRNVLQSDSGCESGGRKKPPFKGTRKSSNNKMHFLDDPSSSSSSDSSSDDEPYQTCHK